MLQVCFLYCSKRVHRILHSPHKCTAAYKKVATLHVFIVDKLLELRNTVDMINLTDSERNAIEANYPTYHDIVRLAQRFYPMSGQLHLFIEELCKLNGWPVEWTFKKIFKEVKPLDND